MIAFKGKGSKSRFREGFRGLTKGSVVLVKPRNNFSLIETGFSLVSKILIYFFNFRMLWRISFIAYICVKNVLLYFGIINMLLMLFFIPFIFWVRSVRYILLQCKRQFLFIIKHIAVRKNFIRWKLAPIVTM
jgi:hypothetical protein